jgi:hypothetical protein
VRIAWVFPAKPRIAQASRRDAMLVDLTTFGFDAESYDEIIADSETSLGRTPEERYRMFVGIQRALAAIWEHFDEAEMRRRLRIAEELDRRPEPWWRNVRPESLE